MINLIKITPISRKDRKVLTLHANTGRDAGRSHTALKFPRYPAPDFIKELMETIFAVAILLTAVNLFISHLCLLSQLGEDDAAGKRIVFHVYLDDGH